MASADTASNNFWNRSHYLDRMNFRDLVVAYFQHYTILSYLLLTALSVVLYAFYPASPLATAGAVVAGIVIYPLVWYMLHRFVLHGQWMYKRKMFASTWKRIHYDHHQDPNHLEVLFGALYTTLPTIAVATIPVGFLIGGIGGIGGAAAAFATGLLTTCYYEFVHCMQHLAFKPKSKLIGYMKQRHLEHHFHHESGNYGITNFGWDKIFRTYYHRKDIPKRSATVFNLGYDEKIAESYPWVKELSGGIASGHPRRRSQHKSDA